MTKFIAILVGMGFFANSAIASSALEIDANGDGLMTADELQAVFPDITPEVFAQIDSNNDGVIDDAEMVAGQEQGLIPAATDG